MKELAFLKEERLLRAMKSSHSLGPSLSPVRLPLDLNVTTDLEPLPVRWLHANCSNCLKMCRQVKPDPLAIVDGEQRENVYTAV